MYIIHDTEEMSKAREQTLPSFTTYCDSSGAKTVTLAEEQNTSMEQNGKPRNRLHKCSQLISDTGVKLSQWTKGSPFSKQCWGDQTPKWGERPPSFTKLKSVWVTDLNVKCKAMKCLEQNTRKSKRPGSGGDFLDTKPKTLSIEEKKNHHQTP